MGCSPMVTSYLSHSKGYRNLNLGSTQDEDFAWNCRKHGSSLHKQHGSKVLITKVVENCCLMSNRSTVYIKSLSLCSSCS